MAHFRVINFGGQEPRARDLVVSSLTIADATLAYMNAGTLTVAGSGTPVQFLMLAAVAAADTIAHVLELKPGDVLEGPYTGDAGSLAVGDSVDAAAGGASWNAADESTGSAGHFVVERKDTANGILRCRFLAS